MIRQCLECGKDFKVFMCKIKIGKGKFCSRECSDKGTVRKPNSGCFKKGEHRSSKTEFKKGEFSREKHPFWKGGRHKLSIGYVMINVVNHPKAYRNEVYEHIIVAEKKLGRYLAPNERVHHINGIKDDNRPENLIVFPSHKEHMREHHLGKKRDGQGGKWL